MQLQAYNPDVLTCLANLSNDEVFTPPNLANEMLDRLPKEIWSDSCVTFLDPVTKTGVFLREIAKRLMTGLEAEFPDRQKRLNHIYSKQLYGVPITELTSLISRRSVYCSKAANGEYSVCTNFNDEQGNIRFQNVEHLWVEGNCNYCGASKAVYDREDALETHAYQFIHTDKPEEIYDMRFDVIIGNPPYQLSDGGYGTSAGPIYQKFVEQAIKLNPRYLSMIIPARWYSGGKGLDSFRDRMLHDDRMRKIVDFPEAIDCFPGVQIKGGVCYFLWDRDNRGQVEVSTSQKGKITSVMDRPLLEEDASVFIRYNEAIPILKKVLGKNEESIISQISSMKPFGLRTYVQADATYSADKVKLYQNGGIGYVDRSDITKNTQLIDTYKVLIPRAGSGSDSFPHSILGRPFIVEPNSACTETYIVLGSYDNPIECANLCDYVSTRFFRFMVLLIKSTQDAAARVYKFVPTQNFKESWSDEKLYKAYGLTDDEIAYIESIIRPMELDNA